MSQLPPDIHTAASFEMGRMSGRGTLKVFDWDEAARRIVARDISDAEAGLILDWDATGGRILVDGKPIAEDDTYVYLASTWATPGLLVDGEVEGCWRIERRWRIEQRGDDWGPSTYWPDSARRILAGDAS